MSRFSHLVWLPTVASAALVSVSSAALLTSNSSFGPNKVVESFEGIAGNGNDLAIVGPYTLPSGSVMTEPTSGNGSFGAHIVNGGFFGMYGADPRIPHGTAYLGQANPSLFDNGIRIVFPQLQLRVGGFLCVSDGNGDAPMQITIYDDNNVALDTTLVRNLTIDNWKNTFIGFQDGRGIRSIRYDGFGGGVFRLDLLTSQVLPEPVSAAGLAGMLVLLRRRR